MDRQIPANLKALKGPKGDKGDPGEGLYYTGVLASTDDLPIVATQVNEAYLIAGDLWAWDGIQWINAGPVQGPPGPEGPRGLQGFPGPAPDLTEYNEAMDNLENFVVDGGWPGSVYGGGIAVVDGGEL